MGERIRREYSAERVSTTAGQVFPDGRVIELVVDRSFKRARLLDYKTGRTIVGDRVTVGARTYVPLRLTPATLRAVCFPNRAQDYGSLAKLFAKLTVVIEDYFAPLERDKHLVAHWQLATWFPDVLPMIPTLVISCPSAAWVAAFFRLLRCGCRRGVQLAEISVSGLRAMPQELKPTLLVDQPEFTRSMRVLIRASISNGVFVTHAGDFLDLRCAKALLAPGDGLDATLTESMLRVSLVPEERKPVLTEREADRIASELQPLLLDYRLRNRKAVSESTFDVPEFIPGLRDIARSLGAAVVGDSELSRGIVSLLAPQDADARARRSLLPEVAIIVVALAMVHEARLKKIFTAEFAREVNVALRAKGEVLEYSAEEVGWKLTRLGLFTRSIGGRRGLRFDRDFSRLVHELARRLGITSLPAVFPRCLDCEPDAKVLDSNKLNEGCEDSDVFLRTGGLSQ
jgi:hypothetical protein